MSNMMPKALMPWAAFEEADRMMNTMFNDLGLRLRPSDVEQGGILSGFVPRVNVAETETAVEVSADLPGLEQADIRLEVVDKALVLQGERLNEEKEDDGKSYLRLERAFGQFVRRIALPCDVDDAAAVATFKNGVLRVVLPKARKTKVKQIAIKG